MAVRATVEIKLDAEMLREKVLTVPEIGTYISFAASHSTFFRRRGVGQMLGLESEKGIVHIRVEKPERIGHLPLSASAFARSRVRSERAGTVPQSAWRALAEWREQFALGEAGAFAVPLHEAIGYIITTVREGEEAGDEPVIESAYPSRDESGVFNIVKVVCKPAESRRRG